MSQFSRNSDFSPRIGRGMILELSTLTGFMERVSWLFSSYGHWRSRTAFSAHLPQLCTSERLGGFAAAGLWKLRGFPSPQVAVAAGWH